MQIVNRERLLSHGDVELRRLLVQLGDAGLAALDPEAAVKAELDWDGHTLRAGSHTLRPKGRIIVLGAGKASLAIARALERVLGERIFGGLVVVRDGQSGSLDRIRVESAEHPLPGARSNRFAAELLDLAEDAGAGDLVICCFTGGSSALASLPPFGIAPDAKRELHRLLLASGAEITEINAVRKHVSTIKGGRLAAACAPAHVLSLTVSDVAGDVMDAITDPSVQDTTTVTDAISVLEAYGLWDHVAPSIRAHLVQPRLADSPRLDPRLVHELMLVTGGSACSAMGEVAHEVGYRAVVVSTSLSGDGQQLGSTLAQLARESWSAARPFQPPIVLVGCGGESTVQLGNGASFGNGGPNQEAALGAALAVRPGQPIAGMFLDTDGADGGTGFAGAVFDSSTARRAHDAGLDLRSALREHRSTGALESLGDLVVTGPTGTNVNDLFALVVGPPEAA
jgi:glycerate 2-kinase